MSGLVGIASLFAALLMMATLYLVIYDRKRIDGWFYAFLFFRSLTSAASVVALTLATANRLRGAWSVTGLITGLLSFATLTLIQFLVPVS